MSQTIAIYFDEPGKLDYPLNEPMYYYSYQRFAEYCAARDTDIVIVRGASYEGSMTFARGWRFNGDQLDEVEGPISVDLIYVKGVGFVLETGPNDLVINHPEFDKVARDKWRTYQAFSDFMPKTFEINDDNWQDVKSQIPTDKIVLKPIHGSGGKGIIITEVNELDYPSLELDVPYLAQEFINSSTGIPGLCDGYHDLRVILFDGEPRLSYLRMPQEGQLLSNISQGASAKVVDIKDVPQPILDLARKIHDHYADYSPQLYTTDFFMEGDKAYLVETNTRPGFPRPDAEGEEFMNLFHSYLFDVLDKVLKER